MGEEMNATQPMQGAKDDHLPLASGAMKSKLSKEKSSAGVGTRTATCKELK